MLENIRTCFGLRFSTVGFVSVMTDCIHFTYWTFRIWTLNCEIDDDFRHCIKGDCVCMFQYHGEKLKMHLNVSEPWTEHNEAASLWPSRGHMQ